MLQMQLFFRVQSEASFSTADRGMDDMERLGVAASRNVAKIRRAILRRGLADLKGDQKKMAREDARKTIADFRKTDIIQLREEYRSN